VCPMGQFIWHIGDMEGNVTKNFDKEFLLQLTDMIIDKDNQVKIATLSDELTISQVVKFFQRQGKSFTKTMIQNYVRVGVLPPPVDKRYYTKDHLILLTLIDNFKAIYSLDDIKSILTPIRNNPDVFDDDIVKTTDVYKNYLTLRREALDKWKEALPRLFDRIHDLLKEDGVKEEERNTASPFMIALTIMAETIAMKDLINEFIKENR
jgi:DNA-binding transcriptional MerR regulator